MGRKGLSATLNRRRGTVEANGTVPAGTEGTWVHQGRERQPAHQGGRSIRIMVIGIQSGGEGERKGQRKAHQNLTDWRRKKRRRRQRKRKNGIGTVRATKERSRKGGRGRRE